MKKIALCHTDWTKVFNDISSENEYQKGLNAIQFVDEKLGIQWIKSEDEVVIDGDSYVTHQIVDERKWMISVIKYGFRFYNK